MAEVASVAESMTTDRNGAKNTIRCAIYTRKSHEEGLDQAFNSLDAQRESAEAYIVSQRLEGWRALPDRYDDGGFSGSNMERPGLKRLLADVEEGKIDVIVVYKIDRLSRALVDFMKMIETFNKTEVSFVSVTQHFNTTNPTGRMFLSILITFAQYEREVIAERIRDKVGAARRRGMYCGGRTILGYDLDKHQKKLRVNLDEARLVNQIFRRFSLLGSVRAVAAELNEQEYRTKSWTSVKGRHRPGTEWNTSHIYRLLNNRTYLGVVVHKGSEYPGEHESIISRKLWDSVHVILSDNTTCDKQSKARTKTISMLHGVIQCGHCDGAMTPVYVQNGSRRYTYFRCTKDARRAVSQCRLRKVPAGEIERVVLEQLSAVLKTPELLSPAHMDSGEIELLRVGPQVEEHAVPEHKRQHPKDQPPLGELCPSYVSTPRSSRAQPALQASTLATLSNEEYIATVQNTVPQFCHESTRESMEAVQEIGAIWEHLLPLERNRLVRLLVEKVEIRSNGIDIVLKTKDLPRIHVELHDMACAARKRSGQE